MPMLSRPLTALSAIAAVATLAACEPSLMGDAAGRGNGATNTASNTSGGNNTWNSPRWAANNPQPPQNPQTAGTQNTVQNPAQNGAATQGAAQQQPPWVNGQQPATVQQGGSTVTSVPLNNNGATTQTAAAVCEDNRPRALDMPGDSCARPCRAAWQRCFDGCNNGQDRACVATCDDTFRECMRGCY